MRRLRAIALSCAATALLLTACGTAPEQEFGQAAQEQTKSTLSFDDLKSTTKMVMTTKADSDLPKTWKYQGAEAKQKAASLVPVLKTAQPVSPGEKTAAGTMPVVIFILDVEGGKAGINVFADQFEFNGNWYKLEQAPEQTYGAVEQLKDEK